MEAPAGTGPGCRAGLGAIADVRPVRGGEPDPGAVRVVEPTDERGGVIGAAVAQDRVAGRRQPGGQWSG